MNKRVVVFLVLFMLAAICSAIVSPMARGVPSSENSDTKTKDLDYLDDLPDVAWYKIVDNDVYIGFSVIDDSLGVIVRAAALNGHKSVGRGFHAWAVDASVASSNWQPGQPGYVCEATARNGQVQDTDCP